MYISSYVKNNMPSILTGMAVAGVVETAIFSVKATPKAVKILEENGVDVKKQPKKAVVLTWRCYLPAAISCAGTIFCILGAHYSHIRKEAGLLAACSYIESRYEEYRQTSRDIFGDQVEAVDQAIEDRKFTKDRIPDIPLKDGLMWCYEPESDQFFQATTEKILWAELTANKMFQNQGYLTFNQFLELLPGCRKVPWGDHFGWYLYDDDGTWDYNWSYYRGTPWIDIQPQINVDGDMMILAYGMHPGDDLDCQDRDIPEQFVVRPPKS